MPKLPQNVVPFFPSASMRGVGPSLLGALAGFGGQGGLIPSGAGPSLTAAPQPTAGPSAGDASPPADGSGGFFRTQNQDGTADYLGGLIHYDPTQDQTAGLNGLSKFGAMLDDIGARAGGGGAGNSLNNLIAGQRSAHLQQQLMAAVQSGDPETIRQAALAMATMSGDPDKLIAASRMNKPSFQQFNPDENVVQFDGQGNPTGMLQRGTPKPQIAGGKQYLPGQGWTDIPGYTEQQAAIARARAQGTAAGKPDKPTAGLSLPKNVGQPWLHYQNQRGN